MSDTDYEEICPDCGQTRKRIGRNLALDVRHNPHFDPKDCVRHLRERLEATERVLEDLTNRD